MSHIIPPPRPGSPQQLLPRHMKTLVQYTPHVFVSTNLQIAALRCILLACAVVLVHILVGLLQWGGARLSVLGLMIFISMLSLRIALRQRSQMWKEIVNRALADGHHLPRIVRRMY